MAKSLKQQNSKWLWMFVTLNILALLAINLGKLGDSEWLADTWDSLTQKGGIGIACIPLVTLILTNLIPPDWKAHLIFWRISNPLPGSRVFSKLAKKDQRIDINILRKACGGQLPRSAKRQNETWYKIYKKHAEKPSVIESHKSYLLTRDIAAMSLLLALGAGLFKLSIPSQSIELGWYAAGLAVFYLLSATAARNVGNRFTTNVLAEESSSN